MHTCNQHAHTHTHTHTRRYTISAHTTRYNASMLVSTLALPAWTSTWMLMTNEGGSPLLKPMLSLVVSPSSRVTSLCCGLAAFTSPEIQPKPGQADKDMYVGSGSTYVPPFTIADYKYIPYTLGTTCTRLYTLGVRDHRGSQYTISVTCLPPYVASSR